MVLDFDTGKDLFGAGSKSDHAPAAGSNSDFAKDLKGRLEVSEGHWEVVRRDFQMDHMRRQAELDQHVIDAQMAAEDWDRKARGHTEKARRDAYEVASETSSPRSSRLSPSGRSKMMGFGAAPPPVSGSSFMSSFNKKPGLESSFGMRPMPSLGDYARSGSGTHTPISAPGSVSISAKGLTGFDASRYARPQDSSDGGAFGTLFSGSTSAGKQTSAPVYSAPPAVYSAPPAVYSAPPAVYSAAPVAAPSKSATDRFAPASASLSAYEAEAARREKVLAEKDREEDRRSAEEERKLDDQRRRILGMAGTQAKPEAKPTAMPPMSRSVPAPTRNATSDRLAEPSGTAANGAAKAASKPLSPGTAQKTASAAASRAAAPRASLAAALPSSRATLGTNPTAERRGSVRAVEVDVAAAKKAMADRIAARRTAG